MQEHVIDLAVDKPTATVISVTPDIAKRWLGRNVMNRNVRELIVDGYARDMAAGKWELTGEPIKFERDGTLLDGQHRLHAVIKSNTTVLMFVVRGLDRHAQRVMDTGSKRTASDALTLGGEKNTSLLSATARIAVAMERVDTIARAQRYQVTHAELIDFIDLNPDIRDAVNEVRSISRRMDCPPAIVAYAYWALARVSHREAHAFFTDAVEKVGLAPGDPVLALTNRLAEHRRNRERWSHEMYLSAIYRCWNARRGGERMSVLRMKSPKRNAVVPVPPPR